MAGGLRRQPFAARHRALAVRIRLDHAGVDREAFAADQPLGHAALDGRLEQLTQKVAVAEAAVPVLGEGRVIRHRAVEPEPAEPARSEEQTSELPSLMRISYAVF